MATGFKQIKDGVENVLAKSVFFCDCMPTGNDTNYLAIAEFLTAGITDGILGVTNIKATLNPCDNIQEATMPDTL